MRSRGEYFFFIYMCIQERPERLLRVLLCDQSGCDAVRGELAIQGVCELSHGGCECLTLLETLVFKGVFA